MTNEQLPANEAREVHNFVSQVLGVAKPLADEAIAIPLDWIKAFRYANTLKIRDFVNRIRKKRGITEIVRIPLKLGIPLLDAASAEDDQTLQEMWAALIANATDPNRRQKLRKVFYVILSTVEPIDTIILSYLVEQWDQNSGKEGNEIEIEGASVTLGISAEALQFSLHNLTRLGCLRVEPPRSGGFALGIRGKVVNTAPSILSNEGDFHPTTLALDLLKACKT